MLVHVGFSFLKLLVIGVIRDLYHTPHLMESSNNNYDNTCTTQITGQEHMWLYNKSVIISIKLLAKEHKLYCSCSKL